MGGAYSRMDTSTTTKDSWNFIEQSLTKQKTNKTVSCRFSVLMLEFFLLFESVEIEDKSYGFGIFFIASLLLFN